MRQYIDEETFDYAMEQAKDRGDARCGTQDTDLTGFDPKLLRTHGLIPADERVVRCGTSAEAKHTDAPTPLLNLFMPDPLIQH